MRGVVVLALVGACEFSRPPAVIGDAGNGDAVDAAPDVAIDAAVPRCNPTAPFGAAEELFELNTSGRDFNGRLSPDELTLYFSRSGAIWTSTRAKRTDRFLSAQPITELDAAGEQKSPSVTADGLTMYFNNAQGGISKATRATVGSTWGAVQTLSIQGGAVDPYVTPDGAHLYWWNGSSLQYRANADGSGATAVSYAGTALIRNIVVSDDELVVFAIKETGPSQELWVATRTATSLPFSGAQVVASVNTSTVNAPTWISADGCVLYLFRGGGDMFHMSVATRGM